MKKFKIREWIRSGLEGLKLVILGFLLPGYIRNENRKLEDI